MSRIGKKPVSLPEKVEITLEQDSLRAKGPKGELTMKFNPELVTIKQEEGTILVERKNDSKQARAHHGLYRNLTQNIIQGVTDGFSKKLEIKGVGYRAALKENILELNLGYSHPVQYNIPEGITISFEEKSQNIFTVAGIDKQLVGQTAAEIRSFRKPEPYKGKGIKYSDEIIARKAGKSAAKKEG
ncbi:50S ribosomal protein L6 [Candidatus Gracilibacteria bacterium]|nr:50S ribosomal protein L6 [Candidatus Gracilibacteria bacterium]MCF7819104.1 50S ribosomal protein L6 [Candidatus Gracilibacteria bacterium]